LRFAQWHSVFPEHCWDETRRLVEESSQFRFRVTLMGGAYLLFTLLIAALAATRAACGSLIDPKHGVCEMPNLAGSDHVDERVALSTACPHFVLDF
jgi:hypothetical protein